MAPSNPWHLLSTDTISHMKKNTSPVEGGNLESTTKRKQKAKKTLTIKSNERRIPVKMC